MKSLEQGITKGDLLILFKICEKSTAEIKLHRLSSKIELEKGVWQVDSLSLK